MNRITEKQLELLVSHLNKITGNPQEPYNQVNGEFEVNKGNYHISHAYGGVSLHQMCKGGGIRDVLTGGHVPKRELFNLMHSYIDGIALKAG